jgi:hypothetical protein
MAPSRQRDFRWPALGLWLFLAIWALGAEPAWAQDAVSVQTNRVSTEFPLQVNFHLQVNSIHGIESIILHYGTDGRTCLEGHARQRMEFEAGRQVDLTWGWELERSGALPPQAEIWWQWEIVDAAGDTLWTDRETLIFEDPRYEWETITRGLITLHWIEGDQDFGQYLADLAVRGLERLESFTGVRPDWPVHIVVYPSAEHVREALIRTYDWTGGVALPRYNISILGIAPEELEWAASVIPHELSHLVIGAVVFNCQGVVLPTWLSEGLAVYAEGPLPIWREDLVIESLEKDRLPTLRSLSSGFPASNKSASLAYSQSAAVVHFLISEFGPELVNELLSTMQSGQAIDPALQQIYGFDTAGLDSRWRASLGFHGQAMEEPSAGAPLSPTTVPTLALWTPITQPTATALPSAIPATPKPAATSTFSTETIKKSPAPSTIPAGEDSETELLWVVLGAGGGALLAVILLLLRKEKEL